MLNVNTVQSIPPKTWTEFCLLTRSSPRHLGLQVAVLLLQGFDVIPLVEEEVGDHRLAGNQETGQQGKPCHLVGAGGTAPGDQEEKEKLKCVDLLDMFEQNPKEEQRVK